MFYLIPVGVPLLLYAGLPIALGTKKHRWILLLACVLFFVSWFLPSPPIDGMRTQFFTHFVGGGVFCGVLWLYLVRAKVIRLQSWWQEVVTLFALVSSLGVVNELFEIFLYEIGHMPYGIRDTSWDLLANTLGALAFYVLYKAYRPKKYLPSDDK